MRPGNAKAREALDRACRDDVKVDAVAQRATKLRLQNGFAEAIRTAMGVDHDHR